MNRRPLIVLAFVLCAIAAATTAIIFKTHFAKVTIDAWSFGASLFLIVEAFYRMCTTNDEFWPNQVMRLIRIVIGICIFTIHTCQVIYGV